MHMLTTQDAALLAVALFTGATLVGCTYAEFAALSILLLVAITIVRAVNG
jgi:hypothetical protein